MEVNNMSVMKLRGAGLLVSVCVACAALPLFADIVMYPATVTMGTGLDCDSGRVSSGETFLRDFSPYYELLCANNGELNMTPAAYLKFVHPVVVLKNRSDSSVLNSIVDVGDSGVFDNVGNPNLVYEWVLDEAYGPFGKFFCGTTNEGNSFVLRIDSICSRTELIVDIPGYQIKLDSIQLTCWLQLDGSRDFTGIFPQSSLIPRVKTRCSRSVMPLRNHDVIDCFGRRVATGDSKNLPSGLFIEGSMKRVLFE